AFLLERCAADAESGGIVGEILEPYADRPLATVPGLRLMSAMHRLVLEGHAPALAGFYPSMGGFADPSWPAFLDALHAHAELVRQWASLPVQTNEPGRSSCLFGALAVLDTR